MHANIGQARLDTRVDVSGVMIATPNLPTGLDDDDQKEALRGMLDALLSDHRGMTVRWYYTPMMLPFSEHLDAACTVYDCMDELANFRFAPPELVLLEHRLFAVADMVFTGGHSLYEAKKQHHPSVHAFPSSVDVAHFSQARNVGTAAAGRHALPRPRFGFYGVIDERMNIDLVTTVADARPEWSLELIGPIVKIDPSALPQRDNIAYPGPKDYEDLPHCAAEWDVALMPFAINEATRFISPTKTPEYLAAGLPVVSTPITDVVRHYGDLEAVLIADTADEFIAACETALELRSAGDGWRAEADALLANQSWDQVAAAMLRLIMGVAQPQRPLLRVLTSSHYDYLVVGAGFAGAVMAERLASSGKKVIVVDRRPHIAGNAYDRKDAAGILIHQYGPHIFHTNSVEIFDYLSRFTEWRPYEHRVLASIGDQLLPIPINRTTLNRLYGLSLRDSDETAQFLASRAEPLKVIRSSEDVVLSSVGRELYEAFFRGYTRKQWGIDPSELDKSVTARVPTRTCTDDRYFTDRYQFMPKHGYTAMFEAMLANHNIDVELSTDFADARDRFSYDRIIFTGPIDEYFGFRFGKLPYRSLRFDHVTEEREWGQPVAVVNYPDEAVPFTRVTEYKHLTGQQAPQTSLTYEYPQAEGDPYYPIPRAENQRLYKRYEALAAANPNVLFVGRLATYRYYNMDQVVGQALAASRRHLEQLGNIPTHEAAFAE